MLQKFPLIVGPTAGGKSSLALALAGAIGERAAIVSADSMQVFRGMDIGTAKPSAEEQALVPHHLIDIAEPEEAFSVDRWLRLAEPLIDDLRGRSVVPIVVGGTHLYAQSLLFGLFDGPEADEALRAELGARSIDDLRAELERVDPAAAARIHPNDSRRTIRALEVHRLTGRPISEWQREWQGRPARADALLVGIDREAENVNQRINARVRQMVERGLVDEVRALWSAGRLGPQAGQALGYKQLVDHFEGGCSLDSAVEGTKIETRRLAKNQRTWLRRLRAIPGSAWITGDALDGPDQAQTPVNKVLSALTN